ncbi:MAG: hypothetical protein GY859_17710 [Desulfobacterales bacterium]|nr:hypothetical protein [Desulfobacterales bacterium]
MKFFLKFITVFTVFLATWILIPWRGVAVGAGRPVVVVECLKRPPYHQTVTEFVEFCNGDVVRLFVADMEESEAMELIKEYDPRLIFAVGWDALVKVGGVEKTPVLYAHTLHPEEIVGQRPNFTGVGAIISPGRQLSTLKATLPGLERAGLLYTSRTAPMAKEARMAAARAGVKLIALEVKKQSNIALLLEEMREEIEVLWLLPDTDLLTDDVIEYIFLYSSKNKKAIFAISDKYVEMGAFLAVDVDAKDLGEQIAGMANRILAGEDVGSIQRAEPRTAVISLNNNTAREFGIAYDKEIIKRVKFLH